MHTNQLINETSPYLLQHAHNPVNWYPWGDEAFAKAKAENKPIFLSIGYSTCYWCHVMEVESFEDSQVAKVINEHFIAIKVDREERPDIDEQYMIATELLTSRGGWPNSVWLTPDGKPWMAGTYFPKDRFILVLNQLHDFWINRRDDVQRQADSVVNATRRAGRPQFQDTIELQPKLITKAREQFLSQFDSLRGGFGGAPKFPPHGTISFLLQQYRQSKDPQILQAINKTLDAMWLGGFHDHIGGGFHRYSTDSKWLLPHFEKMLYDNAQLMGQYAEAFELTGEPRYREAVDDIYRWMEREMKSPEGGYYSALDSGEVGKEGESYVWSIDQVRKALQDDDASLFADLYRLTEEGNFRDESTGELSGKNIPHLQTPITDNADRLQAIRERLLQERLSWDQPHKDDKVLTSWNGLMIASLAKAGRILQQPKYIDSAESAANFLWSTMLQEDTLLRSYRNGVAKQAGYLDDYVFFANGLLELYDATKNKTYLDRCIALTDRMIQQFEDGENGGFSQSGESHETLLVRSKFLGSGGNLPNANGVAANLLIDLSKAANDDRYLRSASKTLEAFAVAMDRQPHTNEQLLIATDRWIQLTEKQVDAKDDGVVTARQKPISVSAKLTKSKLNKGDKCELSVTIQIDSGFHLYAENKDVDFVAPTKLRFESADGIQLGAPEKSKPTRIEDPVIGQTLEIYEKSLEYKLPISVATSAKEGQNPINITIDFQACDDKTCLQPQTIRLVVPLLVEHEQDQPSAERQ
ncbi:DUF255 domain-containing protein [Stieleria sp. JC731]|uniref:DUF255 domain-containing protein n=1 Tax=Pirellulaceae TaxID=2691357 RepID=UPI001E4E5BE1|nr:DUF255 domain-containing protein [Stieleria sp. JC731]MCC9600716.1 DUF255 domain-containing protein [Stieleria sp. JC731]